jgi:hypothetical protein
MPNRTMGRNLTDSIERGCVGLSRCFGKVWLYMNNTGASSRAARILLHCKDREALRNAGRWHEARSGAVTCIFADDCCTGRRNVLGIARLVSYGEVWVARVSASER